MTHYKLRIDDDDNQTFLITSPDFPEVTTFAETKNDIIKMGWAAIEEAICARMYDKKPIPAPHKTIKGNGVRVPILTLLKIALYNEVLAGGQKRYGFGKKLGLSPSQTERLFDIRYQTKLKDIEEAFSALNIEADLSIRKVAA